MGVGFHAFGDHVHLQAVGHVDDGAGDGGVVRALVQIHDEGTVDLQGVHRETLQVAQ